MVQNNALKQIGTRIEEVVTKTDSMPCTTSESIVQALFYNNLD